MFSISLLYSIRSHNFENKLLSLSLSLKTSHKAHHEIESTDLSPDQCIILRGVTSIRGQYLYRCVKEVFSGGMRLRKIIITKCKIINEP